MPHIEVTHTLLGNKAQWPERQGGVPQRTMTSANTGNHRQAGGWRGHRDAEKLSSEVLLSGLTLALPSAQSYQIKGEKVKVLVRVLVCVRVCIRERLLWILLQSSTRSRKLNEGAKE